MKRIIIGISGASGAIYGIRALQILKEDPEIETHLILSQAAGLTIEVETDWKISQVQDLASVSYPEKEIGAPVASGSFQTDGMLIAPCSIKTLSAVANSYADNLLTRAADVQLKEGRPVVLMVRETPLHSGHIRLMSLAAASGAVIFPPVPAFYGRPQSLDEVVSSSVGRALSRLGIDNSKYPRWEGGVPGGLGD
ncbi:MAG TPA: UbiX family flavin prenyltransferase [Chloroflexi bacterium]|nr:MAG: 3-octaprenyl-4-hydroxybenzoate carboxy-lyase [Chloroflexota bacterium]HDD55406.1 UbiX family flavin prenyltransferase [Chloroflexota bacterium]